MPPETIPTIGEFVEVRGRHWLVEDVLTLSHGLAHLELSCISDDAQGEKLSVVWSAEIGARRASGDDWVKIGEQGTDDAELFSAYLRTLRWNSVTAADRKLFQAPFRAGIKLDAFQLEPLRKALELPRVNLLIADDVGLGKTIEAGLIVRELLLRRQISFMVVSAPPSMTLQWREELEAKFGLTFQIIDRDFLRLIRNRCGFGANPWATGSQFIISHRLLVDEIYTSGLRERLGEYLAKSLFILDEAHHAAPASGSGYAVDSQFTRAVRDIAKRFENRLFLTATPHNGHSNSFSALLEMLDPQRFTRGVPVIPRQRDAIMIRRLKEDLRRLGVRFPERKVIAIRLDGLPEDTPELILSCMLNAYGELRNRRISKLARNRQTAARLVFSGLQQRLLSSIFAFEKTLRVHRGSLERLIRKETVRKSPAAAKAFAETPQDTLPLGLSEEEAAEILDADEIAAIEAATAAGAAEASIEEMKAEAGFVDEMLAVCGQHSRKPDHRVKWLTGWINKHLAPENKWNNRRLIIFTEYEDTRRWLQRRLEEAIADTSDPDGRIGVFSGITSQDRREEIKLAFNAPPEQNPLRILICTDAAREGINLQMQCHDLVHFDLPWNPSRLEQRNGRIDRMLQPSPEVYCRYFIYPQREIDIVLNALVRKTETIRIQLGSMGKVIEDRIGSLFTSSGVQSGEAEKLAGMIESDDGREALSRARREIEEEEQEERLNKIRKQLDQLRKLQERSRKRVGVDPGQLSQVMNVALQRAGASLENFDSRKIGQVTAIALDPAHPAFVKDASWARAFDDLRVRPKGRREKLARWRAEAAIRQIAFEPPELEDGSFAEDVVQVHLEHRLIKRLLSRFVSQGFQSGLNRVCILRSRYAEPRVVLLGRISLYGKGAARLHEEIIPVTARWREHDRETRPLQPLKETGQQTTLEQLADALVASRPVNAGIIERIQRFVQTDIAALRPELEARAKVNRRENEEKLRRIGEAEARSLREILEEQKKQIEKRAFQYDKDTAEPMLPGLGLDARKQKKKDRAYWSQRIRSIEEEIEREPERLRDSYAIRASRLEPVGIVYLWPETG